MTIARAARRCLAALLALLASATAAVAVAADFDLAVTKSGTGAGLVFSFPAGIDCGPACVAPFAAGTTVTLRTDAGGASVFTGWSGAGCSGTGSCVVTMDAAKSVTATFESTVRRLSVAKGGTGAGFVASSPAGISCGATCSADFAVNGTVSLTADAGGSAVFSGWSGGGCSGTGACTVTMDAAKTVTATFESTLRTLSVTKAGTGSGFVASSPAGIACGDACSAGFPAGGTVTLRTDAAGASVFAGWSGGGCSGTGDCTVTMDAAKAVTATFVTNASLTVTSTSGDGSLAAILAKLNEACPGGETRISFNIPAKTDPGCDAATGICRLDATADPVVRCSGVVIDGYTQPGASPNTSSGPGTDAAIRIELGKPGVSPHTAAKAVTPGTFLVQGPPTANGFAEITGVTVRGIAFPLHRLVLAPGESGGKLLGGGGHVVAGNAFGLHADGTPSGTFAGGVALTGNPMTGVRIGGPAPADRNRFAGLCCGADAIDAWGAAGALVEGNLVNIDAKGEPIAGSGVARGISIDGNPAAGIPDSRGNLVRRNVVANTLETPVHTGAGGANTVSETLVFGQPAGVPGHDFVSPAEGGRNAQQPPVVSGVLAGPDAVRVAGKATGAPGGTTRIEFFHNDAPDASGDGRAQAFAGAVDVKLDAAGSGPFAATLPASVRNLAATATDSGTGDTSRFADPRTFPAIAVDALALAFAPQSVGTTSPVQAVTIANTGALSVSLAPAAPTGPFTVDASACPATLAPGGACELGVRFAPASIGTLAGELVVHNGAGIPVVVSLAGTGVADTTAPTAVIAAPATGRIGVAVALDASASSDVGGRIVRYAWTAIERPAGSTAFPSPVVTRDPAFTFTPDKLGRYTVQLVVTDDSGNESTPASAIVVVADTEAPTAVLDAPARGVVGQPLALSGARSTDSGGGRIVRYAWTAIERPAGATALAAAAVTRDPAFTFTPDKGGPWRLQLVVTDDAGNEGAPAIAVVDVIAPDDTAPTAVIDAPAQGVAGQPLALSGARSTDAGGGRIVQFAWSAIERPAGSTAFASPVVTTDPSFSFTPDKGGTWRLQLVATDDSGNASAPALAQVTVITPDTTPPMAVVTAPAMGRLGVAVTLDASASSDVGGRIVRYTWTAIERPAGSTAFASPVVTNTPAFAFTPDRAGTWRVQLVVTDDSGNQSAPAAAVIRVLPHTEPSSPDARLRVPPLAQEGGTVTLDGSASTDRDGTIVRYQWSALVRPPGSTALATPAVTTDPAFTFVADRPGLYLVQLVVVDDTGLVSRPDTAPVVVLRKLPPVRGGR